MDTGKVFTVKTRNCIKIAKLIEQNMGKNQFAKDELQEVYEYVMKNYKSELNPADFRKISEIIGEFVRTGGRVEFE
jgi:hypothetical protein